MSASNRKLQLIPIHNRWNGKTLPLSLGRKEVITWWWQACPCQGVQTRKPCNQCRSLSKILLSLSKSMLVIQANGRLQIAPNNRNPSLLWINGDQASRGKDTQLQANDIISIGISSNEAWMTFELQECIMVVSPEWTSTRKPRSGKRRSFFHRFKHTDHTTHYDNANTTDSCSNESVKRRLYSTAPVINCSIIAESPRPAHVTTHDTQYANLISGKKKRKFSVSSSPDIIELEKDYEASSSSTDSEKVMESASTSDNKDGGENTPAQNPCKRQKLSCTSSPESAVETKMHSSNDCPNTQPQITLHPSDQSSVICLPQCHSMEHPTPSSSSSSSEDALTLIASQQQSKTNESCNNNHGIHNLTTENWTARSRDHPSLFHRSLAAIVVSQRVRRKEEGWLPSILQQE